MIIDSAEVFRNSSGHAYVSCVNESYFSVKFTKVLRNFTPTKLDPWERSTVRLSWQRVFVSMVTKFVPEAAALLGLPRVGVLESHDLLPALRLGDFCHVVGDHLIIGLVGSVEFCVWGPIKRSVQLNNVHVHWALNIIMRVPCNCRSSRRSVRY